MNTLKNIFLRVAKIKPAIFNLFLICALFQIYLMSRVVFLYQILKVLFVLELILLAVGLFLYAKKKVFIILCIAFVVLMRIPFYAHSDGMVLSSDNAQEALQSFEIMDSKTVPFFLLDSSGHNGTLKYLCVAFIYDLIGTTHHYLYFVLFQLMIFLCFLFLIYEVFQPIVDQKLLAVFILANFAFIEVIFDYSLFLRGGPYMEMLFFVFLGIYLFDFSFKDKTSIFLSCYFFLFSVYIHPLATFFMVAFICVVFIHAVRQRQFFPIFALILGGALVGTYHLVYYQLFYPKPLSKGGWYRTEFLSLSDVSLSRLPKMLGQLFIDFKTIFENILSFEFNYGTFFFGAGKLTESLLIFLNRAVVYLSFGVIGLGLFFAVKTLLRRRAKDQKKPEWVYLFFLFLSVIILGRLLLLSPKPFYEPRHNIDLAKNY